VLLYPLQRPSESHARRIKHCNLFVSLSVCPSVTSAPVTPEWKDVERSKLAPLFSGKLGGEVKGQGHQALQSAKIAQNSADSANNAKHQKNYIAFRKKHPLLFPCLTLRKNNQFE